jgi:hypothetical protein
MANYFNNRLSVTLTATQLAQVATSLSQLETILGFRIGLTIEERKKLYKLGPARRPFAEEVRTMYNAGQNFFPPYILAPEFIKDFVLFEQLDSFSARLEALAFAVSDTQMLAGHETLEPARQYYQTAKNGEASGIPGASAVVARLSPFFDGMGNFKDKTEEEGEDTPPVA